ncbi:MAG: cell division protein FtsQ [Paludibacter sp.]|nr:cell division protein FtsQ [Paludibacter sp.]
MRNKSLILKIFIIAAVIIAVGYLLTAFVFFSGNKNKGVCNSVKVNILDENKINILDKNSVEIFISKSKNNPVNKQISTLQTEKLENELLKNYPAIKSVECYITNSKMMFVDIVQREPKFRVMTGAENYYVDSEGKTFSSATNSSSYVPVISGNVTKTFATEKLPPLINFIEKNKFWNAQIEQIYVTDKQDIELVPRVGGAIILFGDLTDIEKKFDKLQTLYSEGFSVIGWNRYKTIDLRFKNQVVCTKNDE